MLRTVIKLRGVDAPTLPIAVAHGVYAFAQVTMAGLLRMNLNDPLRQYVDLDRLSNNIHRQDDQHFARYRQLVNFAALTVFSELLWIVVGWLLPNANWGLLLSAAENAFASLIPLLLFRCGVFTAPSYLSVLIFVQVLVGALGRFYLLGCTPLAFFAASMPFVLVHGAALVGKYSCRGFVASSLLWLVLSSACMVLQNYFPIVSVMSTSDFLLLLSTRMLVVDSGLLNVSFEIIHDKGSREVSLQACAQCDSKGTECDCAFTV